MPKIDGECFFPSDNDNGAYALQITMCMKQHYTVPFWALTATRAVALRWRTWKGGEPSAAPGWDPCRGQVVIIQLKNQQYTWIIFNPIGCKNCRPSAVDSWTWMMGTIGRNVCILEKTNRMVSVQIISHRSMDSRIRVAYIYHSSWLSHIQSTWLIVH